MATRPNPINFIHKHDVEWIISLWLAINGGDPANLHVATTASDIIKGLAAHLPAEKARAVTAALH